MWITVSFIINFSSSLLSSDTNKRKRSLHTSNDAVILKMPALVYLPLIYLFILKIKFSFR